MTNATQNGKPYAGNPHVRFEAGENCIRKSRHGSLLFRQTLMAIENVTLIVASLAIFFFVFSAVFTEVNGWWWGMLSICTAGCGYRMFRQWKYRRCAVEGPDVAMTNHRFFAILLCGAAVRFVLALAMVPRVVSDNAIFWNGIQRWSVGDFVETKSYALTVLYAVFQAIFGIDFQLNQFINAGLGVVQVFLSYDLGFRIFRNRSIACASGLLVAFHPVFVLMVFGVAAEPLFGVLVLLAVRALSVLLCESDRTRGVLVRRTLVLSFWCMATFYCRGNGLFLVLLIPVVLSFAFSWRTLLFLILPSYVCVVMIMALCVGCCNLHILGHFIVSSSEDSNWPILVGSCRETEGKWVVPCKDREMILKQYQAQYPKEPFDLHKAVPIMRAEFKRRWRNNTVEMLKLCWVKYRDMWCGHDQWVFWHLNKDDRKRYFGQGGRVPFYAKPMIRFKQMLAVMMLFGLAMLPRLDRNARRLVFVLLAFLGCNVVNHLVIEAAYRYSYPLLLILPVLAPGAFLPLCRSKRKEVGNE